MEAYDNQSACVAAVVKMLQAQKEENWTLPLMYTVCIDLRLVAQKAEGCNRKFFYDNTTLINSHRISRCMVYRGSCILYK